MTLHAKPSRNGNSPDAFRLAGRDLVSSTHLMKDKLVMVRSEIMHGRNYQHLEDGAAERERDLLRVNSYLHAIIAAEQLGLEIFMAGDE